MQRYVPVPRSVKQQTFRGVYCSSTGPTHIWVYVSGSKNSFYSCLLFFLLCCVHAAESEQIDTYLIWIKDERPFFLNNYFE